jgi:malate dehydrogenase (oxaloacetate-decarboxylating)(NADP+)
MDDETSLREAALDYHRFPTPGKISVQPTKALTNQRDLALAYSPGVAYACLAIAADPALAAELTSRANLVGVVTNGTAVLGLGNIGPLASKPVMEGKAGLFKKFAGIDVFDIEINENDPDKIVEVVAALEPTFGGINLEDIKAPECFVVERKLRARMKIPVFHDDQHGTAIIVAAAILNGLKLVGKNIADVKLAGSGAGAAALSCLNLLVSLGLKIENIHISDIAGVVYEGRTELMDPEKQRFARPTSARTLAEIMVGADVFLGLSAGGVVKPEMVQSMAARPLVLALANPVPEIMPDLVASIRPDAIVCTGRSDFPNQVNNVLCFPFIFRGALDSGATTINEEMKMAAVKAIAELAQAEVSEVVANAYGGSEELRFGPTYLIPKPLDPRLIEKIAPAVAKAAMDSGVATRPITDLEAYRQKVARIVYHSGSSMQPVFVAAKRAPMRVLLAEGEDERVLRAAQIVVDEGLARPVLVGRREVVTSLIAASGLRLVCGGNCDLVTPGDDDATRQMAEQYFGLMSRRGVTRQIAHEHMRTRPTLFGAMLLKTGAVDAMLAGMHGTYQEHLTIVRDVIGPRAGVKSLAAMNLLMMTGRQLFICDTYVNDHPTSSQIVEMTLLAAEEVRRFGMTPVVALLSHSSFGSSQSWEAQQMRAARDELVARAPELIADGEMRGDAALSPAILADVFPGSRLTSEANLLIMPNVDAANISFNLLKVAAGGGITVGPILLGTAKPVHILEPAGSVRRIVNMTALASVDAKAASKSV